jgi:predicted acetyltransferase
MGLRGDIMHNLKIVSLRDKREYRDYFNEYLKELSKYDLTIEFDEKGTPKYKYFDYYFKDDDRYPYWLCLKDEIVGLAMIRELEDEEYEIAEFTVFKEYRGNDNAINFASLILENFNGNFIFSTDLNNIIAVKFWNKFTKKYNGIFEDADGRREWKIIR